MALSKAKNDKDSPAPRSSKVAPLSFKVVQKKNRWNKKTIHTLSEKTCEMRRSENEAFMQEKFGLLSSARSDVSLKQPSSNQQPNSNQTYIDPIPALRLFYKTELIIAVDKMNLQSRASELSYQSEQILSKQNIVTTTKNVLDKQNVTPGFDAPNLKKSLKDEYLAKDDQSSTKPTPRWFAKRLRNAKETSRSSEYSGSKSKEWVQNSIDGEMKEALQEQLDRKEKESQVQVRARRH